MLDWGDSIQGLSHGTQRAESSNARKAQRPKRDPNGQCIRTLALAFNNGPARQQFASFGMACSMP